MNDNSSLGCHTEAKNHSMSTHYRHYVSRNTLSIYPESLGLQTYDLWHTHCLSYRWSNLMFPLQRPSHIQLIYLKRNKQ